MVSPKYNKLNSFFTYSRTTLILIIVMLIACTAFVYWDVATNDFINFDDDKYVFNNPAVKQGLTPESILWAFSSFHIANWHPLTWLSHMFDVQFFGMSAGPHHLMSLFFHILNTLLLFIVFNKLTRNLWRSGFVAALFALHPIHVESVAWISERKDVLSTFFLMLTIWSYIWYTEKKVFVRYFIVILFFAFGLMSKPMLVTLPFVLLLIDYWPLSRFEIQLPLRTYATHKEIIPLRLIFEKIPLFIFSLISCFVTFYAQKSGGAVTAFETINLSTRILNACNVYVIYIYKMIYPAKLAVFYPYPKEIPAWGIAGSILFLTLITFQSIIFIKKRPFSASSRPRLFRTSSFSLICRDFR